MTDKDLAIQNELLQAKLINAEQAKELADMRYELQKTQMQKASRLEDSLFSPALMPHYHKLAQAMARTTVIPKALQGKPEDIFVAMEMGYQLGFSIAQSLQDIAVINGKPCLWGDGLMALAQSHPDKEYITEKPLKDDKGKVIGYVCTIKRKSSPEPQQYTFTYDDAKRANLLGKPGPWTQYPERMLQMRARSFAIRDVFADALRGIKSGDEMIDVEPESKPKHVIEGNFTYDKDASQTDKLNALLESRESRDDSANVSDAPKDSGRKNKPIPNEMGDEPVVHEEVRDSDEALEDTATVAELRTQILVLMNAHKLDDSRRIKALRQFDCEALDELSEQDAKTLLNQLNKL